MRKYLLFIFWFSFLAGNAQIVSSSCSAPDSIKRAYDEDAARFTIHRDIQINSTWKDSIILDPVIRKEYLDALLAVYNATILPARDTVINRLKIHRKFEEIHGLEFTSDSTSSWMVNLANNIFPTGNAQLDFLMNKYYLYKTGILPFQSFNKWVVFKTDTNFNIAPLRNKFAAINGVYPQYFPQMPLPAPYFYGNMFIRDSVGLNFIQLTYQYGWEDCVLGCIYQRNWVFKVYNDCSVEYLGSYGNPLDFTGIRENKLDNSIEVFPNPTSDMIIVLTKKTIKAISLYSSAGTLVYFSEDPTVQEISTEKFNAGIYFLKVETVNGYYLSKVIRE